MEEDNLKNYISMYEELKRSQNIIDNIDKRFFFEFVDTLIKSYKEKEYKYNKALSDLVQAEHENKELKEKIRSYEDEIQEQAKDLMCCEETIRDEHIPISLVKEKIEERKLWLSSNDIGYKDDYVLEVLQELLERS